MKSLLKTFNIPLTDQLNQNKELIQKMNEIAQREEDIMTEKLMKQQEIQKRRKQLEESYELQTLKKQEKIKSKLEKSQKNRIQFLEKINKRCKEKQRVFNEKIKSTTSKRKQSLRQAWKAATKFNEKILQGRTMRHKSFDKEHQTPTHDQQNLNKSLLISQGFIDEEEKLTTPLKHNGVTMRSYSKPIESTLANRSLVKSYDPTGFQSGFNIDKKLEKLQKPVIIEIQERQSGFEQNPQNSYQQKLRKTLLRHQQFMMEQENKKIQQYGERLEKISLSRRKKDEIHKSRLKKSSINTDYDYYQNDQLKTEQNSSKKLNQRLKSQSHTCYQVKRVSDWSQLNKQRRQQLLNAHIEQGNHYLSQNKIRYLKEVLSKNIAYNALEKKIYQQRLRHV